MMANHNVDVDVVLLGRTSFPPTQDRMPVFEFPLSKSFDEIRQRRLFRKRLESTPRIIRVDSKDYVNEKAKDAKAIRDVLTELGSVGILRTIIIGISTDSLLKDGVDVDIDLGSDRIYELPAVLAQLESDRL